MAIEIKPIEPHHIEPAKRVIVSVAEGIYKWGKPTDELLEMFADELNPYNSFVTFDEFRRYDSKADKTYG